MSMWTAIAVIVVAGIVAGIFTDKGKRQHQSEMRAEVESLRERLDHVENNLKERVETLERIVTNPKEDLKRQFDHIDKVS